jgi:hypothetical protein
VVVSERRWGCQGGDGEDGERDPEHDDHAPYDRRARRL